MLQTTEALACMQSETHQALEPVYADMSQIGGTFLLHAASQSRSTGVVQQEKRQEKSKCNTEDYSCDNELEGTTVIGSAIFQLSAIVRAVIGITWTTS